MTYNYSRFRTSNYEYEKFPGPKAGEEMLDFTLHTLDGSEVKLSEYRGKWLVLETGSLTCPMYVKNIRPIDKLTKQFPDVTFLVVYVREAHPGSRRGAHQTLEDKLKLAKESKAEYDEPRQVLVDDIDGGMHRAYGSFPNMIYIINPDGKVVYRCDWSFARNIERILKTRPVMDDAERVQIITAAPWIMIPVTLKGGWDALWDLVVELPGILIGHLKVDFARWFGRG